MRSQIPAMVREILAKVSCTNFALPLIYLIRIFSEISIYIFLHLSKRISDRIIARSEKGKANIVPLDHTGVYIFSKNYAPHFRKQIVFQ